METAKPHDLGLEPFLGIRELADYLGVPVSTLYDWRTAGGGPVARRFGKHLKFALSDVTAWVARQRESSAGRRAGMSTARLAIGTFGAITVLPQPNGRVQARTRYRGRDGATRQVQATGATRGAAERALKAKLVDRSLFQPGFAELTPDSIFRELVTYWLNDLDLEDRISKTTRQLYERNMRTLVLPVFQHLALREIGVARCDFFIKSLAKQSHSKATQARVVLRLALSLAVRHEVLPRNPMDNVSRLHRPPSTPNALTPVEVEAVRAAVKHWESGLSRFGPKTGRAARGDHRGDARYLGPDRGGAGDPPPRRGRHLRAADGPYRGHGR